MNLFATRLTVLASTASILANSSANGILRPYVSSCNKKVKSLVVYLTYSWGVLVWQWIVFFKKKKDNFTWRPISSATGLVPSICSSREDFSCKITCQKAKGIWIYREVPERGTCSIKKRSHNHKKKESTSNFPMYYDGGWGLLFAYFLIVIKEKLLGITGFMTSSYRKKVKGVVIKNN